MGFPADIDIARAADMKPISEIAGQLGIGDEDLFHYGKYMAKVEPTIFDKIQDRPRGKYIDVTAITPTPLGEGKTVNTIGLSLGLNAIGKSVATCLRQPSLGPVFGIKGGAAGGGYSQVVPMDDLNLHLTGDIHAVSMAHNLCAAMIDNHMYHKNELDLDPDNISWRRVVDINDRAMRNISIPATKKQLARETGFDITVASELMAILALASDLQDMRDRIGKIVIGYTRAGKAITTEDLKAAGAMTILMKDAIKPNLLQTVENTPVFVHAGPFGNIAHGNSSIIADLIATRCAEYTVTESGFGADLGCEKFVNIKSRASGLVPDAALVVATVRGLKVHSGKFIIKPGKPLPPELSEENPGDVEAGVENLLHMIGLVQKWGMTPVVAVNRFPTDHQSEIDLVRKAVEDAGVRSAVSEVFVKGGEGGREMAEAIVEAAEEDSGDSLNFTYPIDAPIKDKIKAIAQKVYNADDVSYSAEASEKIDRFTELGYTDMPICMAKSHLSISHDASLKGAPSGFTLPIQDIRASVGANFLYPLCGTVMTMPGLPSRPGAERMDLDESGLIQGLS
jgi:formate--tetrahydrofolate ligase